MSHRQEINPEIPLLYGLFNYPPFRASFFFLANRRNKGEYCASETFVLMFVSFLSISRTEFHLSFFLPACWCAGFFCDEISISCTHCCICACEAAHFPLLMFLPYYTCSATDLFITHITTITYLLSLPHFYC